MNTDSFDSLTADELRANGSLKWSEYPNMIGAFIAEMDFGTAPEVHHAIEEAVSRNAFGYVPSRVTDELRDACSMWQREQYGWEVRGDDIYPVADVLTILELSIHLFSTPGSPVIALTPTYMPFLTLPPAWGHPVVEVPLIEANATWTLDLDAIDQELARGARVVILCNPGNPTGHVFESAQLVALSAVVERHNGFVFADEIHAPLVYSGTTHVPYASVSPAARAHTITATSAAKGWNIPGLKCAQAIIADSRIASTWAASTPRAEEGASTLGIIANIAAYRHGLPWLTDVVSYLDENRRALGAALRERIPEIRYHTPQATYLSWLDCRDLKIGENPAVFFQDHSGVMTTSGLACGAVGAGYLRFNFALPRPIIHDAVEQMADALAQR